MLFKSSSSPPPRVCDDSPIQGLLRDLGGQKVWPNFDLSLRSLADLDLNLRVVAGFKLEDPSIRVLGRKYWPIRIWMIKF